MIEEDGYPAMYNIEICRGEDVECPFLIAGIKGLMSENEEQAQRDRIQQKSD